MEKNTGIDDMANEQQSLRIVREMIQTSKNRLRNNGILFIIWGWVLSALYLAMFLDRKLISGYRLNHALSIFFWVAVIGALLYTVYYVYRQRSRVQTYIGVSLRYIWISMFICLVLLNLIQFNVLHEIIFELQHPVFMVVIAFAITASGAILRYPLLIAGGIFFGAAAYISSLMPLPEQLLAEAVSWLAAFAIPGHVLYAKRKAGKDVQ